jgi:ketosteroid isomerase-like protein
VQTPMDVSESYWAAECRRDIDATVAHYLPDGSYEGPDGLRQGHVAIRQMYEASAREYPGLEVRVIREFRGDDACSAIEFDAVLVDPDGGRHRVRGVNVVAVRDGRFVTVRSYEDPPIPL